MTGIFAIEQLLKAKLQIFRLSY